MQKITPFLWFDTEAREAAEFYVAVFGEGSQILESSVMSDTPSGTVEVLTVSLRGQEFSLMSAGPLFKFTAAVSFVIDCIDQAEVDYFWEKLTADGGEESQCGWLKDKYGLSWQVTPRGMLGLTMGPDAKKAAAATQAMLTMKKIDLAALQKAYNEA